jgi:hypothetical protein
MNSYFLRIVAALSLAALLAIPPARAASLSSDIAVFSVPFSFRAGDETLPAGTYRVERLWQLGDYYWIRRVEGGASATIVAGLTLGRKREPAAGKLVFNTHEGQHFLSQIWMPGDGSGSQLRRSQPIGR